MHWLALREAWWPMAVAVAWVLLRSRSVVEQLLARHLRKPITFTTVATCAAVLKAGGQHTTPKFKNSEAAFRKDLTTPYRKQLYPDEAKLDRDEKHRFELLISHWDIMTENISL